MTAAPLRKPPPSISDAELLQMSSANNNLLFERVDGEVNAMSPVGGDSGEIEATYVTELSLWARQHGGRVFGPSTGFKLPNGDVRSSDAAVLLPQHPEYERKHPRFVPGAPDFLVEIRSDSDHIADLQEKMRRWIANGSKLGWLIDPRERKAYVYRADGSVTEFPYTARLTGEDVLPGLALVPEELDPE